MHQQSSMFRLWDLGQQHLAAARYMAARRDLEAAEAIAWRNQDAQSLARLYLPLLEARRQIRYLAAEGALILIVASPAAPTDLDAFLKEESGTLLLACGSTSSRRRTGKGGGGAAACRIAGSIQYASLRSGRCLEALLLISHAAGHNQPPSTRLASPGDPTFAAGLPVQWTDSDQAQIGPSTTPELPVPLPRPGRYTARDKLHGVARESLIVAWEALALRWQHRHPPPPARRAAAGSPGHAAWEEMAWLRLALRIDPACEPVTMRLIALAEGIQRL